MNDAECQIHNIQWSSAERGMNCPACAADNKLAKLERAAKAVIDHKPAPESIHRKLLMAINKLEKAMESNQEQ